MYNRIMNINIFCCTLHLGVYPGPTEKSNNMKDTLIEISIDIPLATTLLMKLEASSHISCWAYLTNSEYTYNNRKFRESSRYTFLWENYLSFWV